MGNFIPRKYNNTVMISLACLVVVAAVVIAYLVYNKSEEKYKPQAQLGANPHQGGHPNQPPPSKETRVDIPIVGGEYVTDKPTLVLYWADWCGHSIKMKPDWDKVAAALNSGGLAALDFEHHRDVAEISKAQSKYADLKGFPHIRMFPEGYGANKGSVVYTGPRTEEALLKFAYQQ